jgi:hypothetical protein
MSSIQDLGRLLLRFTPAGVHGGVCRRHQDHRVETWADVISLAPAELRPWLVDFEWSRDKLWALSLEEREVNVAELVWLLELPWWRGAGGRVFTVRPIDVTTGPHYERTAAAYLSRPLHAIERHGRLVLLDGIHRLLKATWLGSSSVRVLVVPIDARLEIAV